MVIWAILPYRSIITDLVIAHLVIMVISTSAISGPWNWAAVPQSRCSSGCCSSCCCSRTCSSWNEGAAFFGKVISQIEKICFATPMFIWAIGPSCSISTSLVIAHLFIMIWATSAISCPCYWATVPQSPGCCCSCCCGRRSWYRRRSWGCRGGSSYCWYKNKCSRNYNQISIR